MPFWNTIVKFLLTTHGLHFFGYGTHSAPVGMALHKSRARWHEFSATAACQLAWHGISGMNLDRMYAGTDLGKLLIEEGLIPDNAREVSLHIPVDGVVVLHYDVVVDPEDLGKLTRALSKLGRA